MITTEYAAVPNRSLEAVWEGLNAPQKRIDSRYFYDERGSKLFDEITRLPEYYLTRAESDLLASYADQLIRRHRIGTIVEPGAGSGEKTRLLIDPLVRYNTAPVYVPIDISKSYLVNIERNLRSLYPTLQVQSRLADLTNAIALPPMLSAAGNPHRGSAAPVLIAFLGSTIGNFEEDAAVGLLTRWRSGLREDDRLLIGFDLKKNVTELEAAYNDAAGVTAQFNLNILHVINREAGANFDTRRFNHRAFYNAARGRVEMHLVSTEQQQVRVSGFGTIQFESGETILTEISCKYNGEDVERILRAAGLRLEQWHQDAPAQFAIVTARL